MKVSAKRDVISTPLTISKIIIHITNPVFQSLKQSTLVVRFVEYSGIEYVKIVGLGPRMDIRTVGYMNLL